MRTRWGAALAAIGLLVSASQAAQVTVTNEASGWVLKVDGQPFIVKGVSYTPIKIGESPDVATQRNFLYVDDNGNGRLDSPYDTFVDANTNNLQDTSEPTS